MLTTRHGVRVLDASDLDAFQRLAAQDPVVNVFAAYRARTTNLEPRWLGGEVWGRFVDGELLRRLPRRRQPGAGRRPAPTTPGCSPSGRWPAAAPSPRSSGRRTPVRPFWETVAGSWGTPREQRWDQPHLEIATAPAVAPDPPYAAPRWPTSTPSTRPASRCTPRRSASPRSPAAAPTSTAPGSTS